MFSSYSKLSDTSVKIKPKSDKWCTSYLNPIKPTSKLIEIKHAC